CGSSASPRIMNAGSARETDSAEFANEMPADGTPAALFDPRRFRRISLQGQLANDCTTFPRREKGSRGSRLVERSASTLSAALTAAPKVHSCSVQAGPAVTSGSSRSLLDLITSTPAHRARPTTDPESIGAHIKRARRQPAREGTKNRG